MTQDKFEDNTRFKLEIDIKADYKTALPMIMKIREQLMKIEGVDVCREFEHILPPYSSFIGAGEL